MHFGSQITAPNGWRDYSKAERYYFCGTHQDQVLIVSFYVYKESWRVSVKHESREAFENALTGSPKKLIINEKQCALPPWIEELEGVDFDSAEQYRYKKKKQSYSDQVKKRRDAIEPLLALENQILTSDTPLAVIAKIGRKATPDQHPYRLQLWFFAYVLFGRDLWALKACCSAIGTWDRKDDKYCQKKFGRAYKEKGEEYGWPSLLFADKVVKLFPRYCGLYKTMAEIYRKSMVDDFDCKIEKLDDGRRKVFQPQGLPYPSFCQFRQIIVNEYGLENVQRTLYGHVRQRNRAKVDEGSYVAQLKNVLEQIQVDAYRCDERPKAMFSDEAMPPLVVARAICVKTGAVFGVGFSLGSEDKEAYRSMLMCMALPKSVVAKIYGIPEKMLEWPMSGLSPWMLSDRGPAGHQSLVDELALKFPIKSGAPSYQPRSKSTVEGSNPKSAAQEGAPSFILSDLDVPSMMRRELLRATQQNRSKDITSHMSEEELSDFLRLGLPATPQAYCSYLSELLRTSAIRVAPAKAIKAFGKRVTLQVDRVGVVLHGRHYSSEQFRSEGHHLKAVRAHVKSLTGYTVNMATRYVWVEFDGKLIELEAMKSGSSMGEDYFTPLSALEEMGEALSKLKSRTRKSGQAAIIETRIDFEQLTGIAWDAGVSRSGKPKKGRGTVIHETAVLKDKPKVRRA